MRRCAVWNPDFGEHGAWDADKCTTVLSEQDVTTCECGTFGTFAVIAEMVEDPYLIPEEKWLTVTKYAGFIISLVLLAVFIGFIATNSILWEMFHLMRMNMAICLFWALACMFLSEIPAIREDRLKNIIFSALNQYWIMATAGFLFLESFATFRAITAGIIGGKLWGYVPLAYGLPFINLGLSIFFYDEDYGRDPRVFIGWENETRMSFFYGQWPLVFVSLTDLVLSAESCNSCPPSFLGREEQRCA